MKEQKPLTDRRAHNRTSSMSVDCTTKLMNKEVEKEVKYGTKEGLNSPL